MVVELGQAGLCLQDEFKKSCDETDRLKAILEGKSGRKCVKVKSEYTVEDPGLSQRLSGEKHQRGCKLPLS
jgi:hypothetical protein